LSTGVRRTGKCRTNAEALARKRELLEQLLNSQRLAGWRLACSPCIRPGP
jgi:hypothetical protein